MHALKCPQCGRVLAVKEPVKNSSVRCRGCGAIFTGNSYKIRQAGAETPAPVAAETTVAPPRSPVRRRKQSPLPAVLAMLGIMGCGAAVAVLVIRLMSAPPAGPPPPPGPKVKAPTTRVIEKTPQGEEEVVPAKTTEPTPDMFPNGKGATTKPCKDATVTFTCNRDATSIVNQGRLIGVIKNTSQNVLSGVKLVGINGGLPLVTLEPPCRNLPPGASVPFSCEYMCGSDKNIESMVVTEATMADPMVVAWEVQDVRMETDANSDRVVVTGRTTNTKAGAVTSPVVHCTFFKPNGVQVGEADANISPPYNESLPAGQTASFTLEWKTPEKPLQPKPFTTLVGQMEP